MLSFSLACKLLWFSSCMIDQEDIEAVVNLNERNYPSVPNNLHLPHNLDNPLIHYLSPYNLHNSCTVTQKDIEAVVQAAGRDVHVKVILETCLLTDEEKLKVLG